MGRQAYYSVTPMQAALNGVSFRPKEIKEIIKQMNIGDEVTLEREPTNNYDSNAIKVIHEDGHFLGYVEAEVAAEIAGRIDAGETPHVTIDSFQSTIKPILDIEFEEGDVAA